LVLIGCERAEKKPTEKTTRTYQYNSHVISLLPCYQFWDPAHHLGVAIDAYFTGFNVRHPA
jgi:hypothetical protein